MEGEKVYSEDILFDEDEDDANQETKETNFDIQKIKNAKELAANDESFQPNFVVKKMYFIGHKTEDVREYYDF